MGSFQIKNPFKKKASVELDNTVSNYVESFFGSIHYSRDAEEAKKSIVSALEPVYASMKQENDDDAFKDFVARYPSLETLLDAAGIDRSKAFEWRESKATTSFNDFFQLFAARRKQVWITVALFAIALSGIVSASLYFDTIAIVSLVISLVLFVVAVCLVVRYRKNAIQESAFSVDGFEEMEKLFDRYARKSINWLMILFIAVFLAVFEGISLGIDSKDLEVAKVLSGDFTRIVFFAFFFVKNLLLIRWLIKNVDYEYTPKYKKEFKRILIISLVYWVLAVGLYFVFEYYLTQNITPFFFVLYALFIVLFNVSRLDKFCYAKPRFIKPAVAAVVLVAIVAGGYAFMSKDVWMTQPFINSVPNLAQGNNTVSYDDETGIYTITHEGDSDFKILQLTDIHIGGSLLSYDKDLSALKACYALIEHTRPDLVIVTGDLCFPLGVMSFSFNNSAPVQQFAAFMRNTGIPWAFTYGNHDTEDVSLINTQGLNDLYKSLSWYTTRTLLYPYIQPDIWGRNNQLIEVRNSDGTLNQALFLIDSNAYTGDGLNKYDYIHDDQVDWYADQIERLNDEEGHTVASMVFFHIPLQEYKTATELYLEGSDEVTYYFGENPGDHGGITNDLVCCSEFPSKMFDTAVELGSTTGFFCGHDHYNNASIEYKGIRLTYGMSIDYLAQPGIGRENKQRGGTLITCHPDSSCDLEQIPLMSIQTESDTGILGITTLFS